MLVVLIVLLRVLLQMKKGIESSVRILIVIVVITCPGRTTYGVRLGLLLLLSACLDLLDDRVELAVTILLGNSSLHDVQQQVGQFVEWRRLVHFPMRWGGQARCLKEAFSLLEFGDDEGDTFRPQSPSYCRQDCPSQLEEPFAVLIMLH